MIAGNTQHTGRPNRGYAESWTREQLDGLLSETWLQQMVADIRAGNEQLKDRLPFICPHYAAFHNNHRAQKDIMPETFTFMTCVDVDDKELTEKAIRKALEVNGDAYSDWQDQVLRIAYSARKKVHIYIRIPKGMTIEEAQRAFCEETEIRFDESCVTPERFIYVTGRDEEVYRSEHWLEPMTQQELEERREAYLQRGLDVDGRKLDGNETETATNTESETENGNGNRKKPDERIRFIAEGVMREKGLIESDFTDKGGRHTAVKVFLTGATQLLTKEEMNGILSELMPKNWQDANIQQLVNDFYQKYTDPNQRLLKYQEQLFAQSRRLGGKDSEAELTALSDSEEDERNDYYQRLPKMPQGVRDSIDAVGPLMAMPAIVAVAPVIGMLATGVKLDIHGVKNTLNLISYVVGDFASGKGAIDPVIAAWTAELKATERVYIQQEDEWRAKKLASKNKKEQPEEPKLPMRLLTLNNTVANLAERLAHTDGRHAFSFTPEADTVAQKWKSSINDFSLMLRQSYDGSPFDREARSVEAVNVHIDHLLWNVTMCGTPDALYRVVTNYTDGFQSRIALARTPDNTFTPLADKPYVLTDRQSERIGQVAHLLPLMQGSVVLTKLEAKGREWVERVRVESMKSYDTVKARQRFRICVTAQRMTCCIMLCKVADQLIAQHGLNGAEKLLKEQPSLWMEMLEKTQKPQLLGMYDVMADYLMDCALYFFRERIERAFSSRDYAGALERRRMGKNDSIYARLETDFSFEAALSQSIVVNGATATRNQVRQMLKNWKRQGLITQTEACRYHKVQQEVS